MASRNDQRSRREFLRKGLFGLVVGSTMPAIFGRTSLAIAAESFLDGKETHPERILVVVELTGGNDGLNTAVPYSNDTYHRLRPNLAIPTSDVIRLDEQLGLHFALAGVKSLWDEGNVAIVQGCGYPNPNRSHFASMEYWHTAVPNGADTRGWVGRLSDAAWPEGKPNTIVNIAGKQSLAVQSNRHAPVTFSVADRFVRLGDASQNDAYSSLIESDTGAENKSLAFLEEIARNASRSSELVRDAIGRYETPVNYGNWSKFASDLTNVTAMIDAGFPTRVYYVSLGNFDTHSNQSHPQELLLYYLGDALRGFFTDLARIGRASDVTLMTFTEFGRRAGENASLGTDHGTATPMFVIGENVKGGLYGEHPNLDDLDDNGDLKMTVDFRRVYATMIDEWLGYDDAKTVLKGNFPMLGVFG